MPLQKELRDQGDFLFRYRSYLPLVIIFIGLGIFIYNEINNQMLSGPKAELFKLSCLGICILGLLVRIHAIGHAAPNTSGRNTIKGQIAEAVNKTGLYSICRHPIYVGNFLMWIGIAGLTQEPWFLLAFVFIFWVYYERIMYAEEAFLIEKHGINYTDWSEKTPAFWPKFSLYKKAAYPFSWAKVLRQEKSGIVNMFLIFFVFESIGSYIRTQGFYDMKSHWFFFLVGSVIYYVVIKTLQKTTKVLDGR